MHVILFHNSLNRSRGSLREGEDEPSSPPAVLPTQSGSGSPSRPTPCRDITHQAVRPRILMSSHRDQLSTYHTSYSKRCSIEMESRPLIWAQPVIPGRTS